MSILVKSAEEQITAAVSAAIEKAVADGAFAAVEIPAFKVEIPADKANGDYSANAAFMLSKALRMPPRKIAEEIEARLSLEGSYFERAQTAGAGFLNFFLGSLFYADILLDIAAKGENYGHSDMGAGKSALVEFVSANPTGPMHVGNARGGALGDCLASVLSWAGYRTEREFYVNDSGNQIEKFALSLDLRYLGLYLDGIEMPEDSYHGEDIIAHAKAFAAEHGDSLITSDEAARRKALVDFALPKNIAGLETDLLKYRIKYDTW
ncbi:MAG: arginine--tRNA ligase, partial [Clostridiales bacterium]|nr:arginine--tRNA ligase [Clostridiales bacterium]